MPAGVTPTPIELQDEFLGLREELMKSREQVEELKQADTEMRDRLKKIQLQQSREKKDRFDPIGQPPDKEVARVAKYQKKYEKNKKALEDTLDDILGEEGEEKKTPAPAPKPKKKAQRIFQTYSIKEPEKKEAAEEKKEEEAAPKAKKGTACQRSKSVAEAVNRPAKKPKLIGDTMKKFSKAAQRKKEADDENPAPAKPRKPEGRVEFIKVAPPKPAPAKSVEPQLDGGLDEPAAKKSRTGSQKVVDTMGRTIGRAVKVKKTLGKRVNINPAPASRGLGPVGPQEKTKDDPSSIVDKIAGEIRGKRPLPKGRAKSLARPRAARA